jgi:hypothetical protein
MWAMLEPGPELPEKRSFDGIPVKRLSFADYGGGFRAGSRLVEQKALRCVGPMREAFFVHANTPPVD